ncbi:metal ABC transporter permease [Streptomyces sp. TG1A-60]|uniref:metal ABC transporter permease n=1 Tax=Streptomyces sp. TG1A-60 TaxID=3129111 RepID=UPI0030D4844B
MSDLIAFFTDPWQLPFMQRVFAVAAIIGLVCGVIGVYVVLRGMAFIGDAVAHSAFPGVALAYAFEGNLLLGGAAAGITTAVLIAFVSQNRRLKEDTVIGVFFAFAFGLGIVLVSTRDSWTTDLSSFLFGHVLAVSAADVVDLDLPDVIALRRGFFTDTPRRTMIAASVSDEAWADAVAAHSGGPYLFVAEAVLPFLTEADVHHVIDLLATRFPGSTLALDTAGPGIVDTQDQHDALSGEVGRDEQDSPPGCRGDRGAVLRRGVAGCGDLARGQLLIRPHRRRRDGS